jgi:hypothetical protein
MDPNEIRWEVVDWIHLVQNSYQWQDLVNTVMNLVVIEKGGVFTG